MKAAVVTLFGAELLREIDALRGEKGGLRSKLHAEVTEVRGLHALTDGVVRIEGSLTGPWRPANGSRRPESNAVRGLPI